VVDREIARQAAQHQDTFVVLRYEDLVLRPEPVLRELLDWLGEPWSDQVLQHHEVQTARGGRVVVEGTNRIDDPIDVSRVAKWHARMSESHRQSLATRLGRLSEFFGYDMTDPAVLAPVGDPDRFLMHGREIDERIDAFADLNLREKGEPGLAERHYHPGRMQLHGVGDFAKKAPPPPEPPFSVRVWHLLPLRVRRRFSGRARRIRSRIIRARRRLRR